MLNYAKLTPVLWNIAKHEEVEVGNIAWPMLEDCIKQGVPAYKGADGPEDFAADFADFKAHAAAENHDHERRFFIKAWQGRFQELCGLWKDQKYMDMIVLVAGEMAKLAVTESPEERERYERHKKELEELAKKWKAEQQ